MAESSGAQSTWALIFVHRPRASSGCGRDFLPSAGPAEPGPLLVAPSLCEARNIPLKWAQFCYINLPRVSPKVRIGRGQSVGIKSRGAPVGDKGHHLPAALIGNSRGRHLERKPANFAPSSPARARSLATERPPSSARPTLIFINSINFNHHCRPCDLYRL